MHTGVRDTLVLVLYLTDKLVLPTFVNLTESYEQWEHRRAFQRGVKRLERHGILQQIRGYGGSRRRLTPAGLRSLLGGLNPRAGWSAEWDGKWTFLVFDFPANRKNFRERVLRWLRKERFGCLQGSLWVRPRALAALPAWIAGPEEVATLLQFSTSMVNVRLDEAIVSGAWDFEEMNSRYRAHLAVCEELDCEEVAARGELEEIERLVRLEREAWEAAVRMDPFLPDCLLPAGYLGKRSWEVRSRVLGLGPVGVIPG